MTNIYSTSRNIKNLKYKLPITPFETKYSLSLGFTLCVIWKYCSSGVMHHVRFEMGSFDSVKAACILKTLIELNITNEKNNLP